MCIKIVYFFSLNGIVFVYAGRSFVYCILYHYTATLYRLGIFGVTWPVIEPSKFAVSYFATTLHTFRAENSKYEQRTHHALRILISASFQINLFSLTALLLYLWQIRENIAREVVKNRIIQQLTRMVNIIRIIGSHIA